MSMANQPLSWKWKDQKVFDKGKSRWLKRHSMIDDYSNDMNHADWADQLCVT
jgi:hypothetical protein